MSTVRTEIRCGACGQGNVDAAQFCAGCGHALFEPCASCSQPVRLEQKYCGGCGTDLQQRRDKTRDQFQTWLASSIEAAKQSDFDQALGLLERVAANKDYRFAELSKQATAAKEKVGKLRDQRTRAVEDLLKQAEQALAQNDKAAVVDLLSRVPLAMRTPEMRTMLDGCASFVKQVQALEAVLQAKIAEKDYEGLGGTIEELLELLPDNETYRKLARKVADKLLASSQRRYDRQEYEAAASKLACVPSQMRDATYEAARQLIENAEWLEKQFLVEPYATATLGRLAIRFEKDSPQNERAKANTQELMRITKQPLENPRVPFNPWRGSRKSWMGGSAEYLGYATKIVSEGDTNIRRNPGRFSVAYGLALQGLGHGVVSESFSQKKGLIAKLSTKKSNLCWGIDIGTSALRAVLLQKNENEIVAIESYSQDFPAPLTRIGNERNSVETIREAVTAFLEAVQVKEVPCWANLPAGDIVTRFVRLPPVKDKKADELLKAEIEQRIPLPTDTLDLATWIGPLEPESSFGRPAVACAAKKSAVMSRTDMLAQAGLKIAGLQAEQLATVNFMAYEFASEIAIVSDEPAPEAEDAGKKKKKKGPEPVKRPDQLPTIALVDAGASFTTLTLVSEESFWFWSIETGGEDLTSAVARGTKSAQREAEDFKRIPAKMDHPKDAYEPVERKLDELRSRLEKLKHEGTQQNGRFDIIQTWCVGGGPLAHSWIRRVLVDS